MKKLLFVVLLLSVAVYGAEAKVKGKVLDGKRIELTTDTPGTFTLVYEGAGRQQLAGYAWRGWGRKGSLSEVGEVWFYTQREASSCP